MTTWYGKAMKATCFVTISLFILAGSAAAIELTFDHLNTVPRTEAEAARIANVVKPTENFETAEAFENNPGGGATVRASQSPDVFSQPSANISFEKELDFRVGNGLFKKLWVSSPSSTLASDGLGPLYNARSCQRCHLKDGRGHTPNGTGDTAVSMLLRVSIPGDPEDAIHQIEGYFATRPDPVYGEQLQDFGLAGHAAEYRLSVTYDEIEVTLSDGETARLRTPKYEAADLGYGPLHPDAMLSPRIAPQMIGLGLLEAIPAEDILALTDPDDTDKDGISGRANIVWSAEFDRPMLGRFGLKAGVATIHEHSAAAFVNDIGISSTLFPSGWGECTDVQEACRAAPNGNTADHNDTEISDEGLELVTFYSRNLAVPARRDVDDTTVLKGKKVFYDVGCTGCHQPKFVTHRLEDQPEQSFQLIWPYTDMLLHDMGEGLADHRPEARANGREWRTPPLWGIGLTEQVSGHTQFLHDGRARSLLEAILWHGGEAQKARDAVVEMPKDQRDALLKFLESL